MNNETANYIITYFSGLLTNEERMAIRHTQSLYKLEHASSDNSARLRIFEEKGWLTSDQAVLDLLKDGYESFELHVGKRIMSESPDKVFLNNCPECCKLARTPYARQCKHCGFSWHDMNVAKFTLKSSVQISGRHFFLLGEIARGEIKQGQFIDLTMLGLNSKPRIEVVEFALKREDGKSREDVALGTDELTEEEKAFLIRLGSFGTPVDIIR